MCLLSVGGILALIGCGLESASDVLVRFTRPLSTPVFGLHAVTEAVNNADKGSVTVGQLQRFIRRARSTGHTFVSLREGVESPSPKKIVLTFDDGYLNNYTVAAPVLERENVPAVFFVHPDTIGTLTGAYPKMTWRMVRELDSKNLFQVESHSSTHRDLRSLTATQLRADFDKVENLFVLKLGRKPEFIAYPMGQSSPVVQKIAEEFYKAAFSYGTNASSSPRNQFALPRLDLYGSKIDRLFVDR